MPVRTTIASLILCLFISGFANAQGGLSDTIDVIHYDINLDILDVSTHEISGYTEVEFTTPLDNFDKLILELMDLTVTNVTVNDQTYDFTHENERIVVQLDDEFVNGEILNAKIYYEGEPFHEGWGGFHFSGTYCFNLGVGFESNPHNLGKSWFPCVDDFIDRALYDYHIRVSEGNAAVCGGILQETIEHDDNTVTYSWKMDYDIPTYLASAAVGEYEVVEDVYNGINGEIPIQYWVKPVQVGLVEGSFVNMHAIMDIFESHWGAYPYSRIGYVSTALGAMEHATNIAYPSGSINGNTDSEWLYAHELAHMWFGDKVTCASAEDMWLNEGWARFNESLFTEGLYGPEAYRERMNDLHEDVIVRAHTSSGDGSYLALYGIPNDLTYGMTVYDKGGIVTHTLRYYLGDEVFFPAIRGYLEEFAYQPASSWDLRDYLTDNTGVNMTDFFDNWVFEKGFPAFEVDSFAYVNNECTVWVGQKLRGTDVIYNSNRLDLTFVDENWDTHTERIEFSGETGVATFSIDFEPIMVLPDFYDHIADATTDKDLRINEAGETVFERTHFELEVLDIIDSAFIRVTHNWVAPDPIDDLAPGLKISDSRYWRIEGDFPETFDAKGRFYFNGTYSLDNSLFQSMNDVPTLLYREGPGHEWQLEPFTLYGPGFLGYLIVDQIKTGEYSIAVFDEEYTNVETNKGNQIKVYPNPGTSYFKVELEESFNGTVLFYDNQGVLVDSLGVNAKEFSWTPVNLPSGEYNMLINYKDGKILSKKVILKQ
jgi:aminopeptidase N